MSTLHPPPPAGPARRSTPDVPAPIPTQKRPALNSVAVLGTHAPRRCGIATFTHDLAQGLLATGPHVCVIAVDEAAHPLHYPEPVQLSLPQHAAAAYAATAALLRTDQHDALIVQHEFGIYGGPDGICVLDLIHGVDCPVIVTLHTVLTEPTPGQRRVMEGLQRTADRLVVMSERARSILRDVYAVPDAQIAVIPHGVHLDAEVDRHVADGLDLAGKKVLMTFGLLSRGKGIETAIRALPQVVAEHPDVIYLIVGATHPHVLRDEGNAYRDELQALARQLGVADHLRFHDAFLSLPRLHGLLHRADLYVVPYPHAAQIASGTLAYAVGAGKAIVSTPFWHAEELLAEGRGVFFPFHDSAALARALNRLLGDPDERKTLSDRTRAWGQHTGWPAVAGAYASLCRDLLSQPPKRAGGPDLASPPTAAEQIEAPSPATAARRAWRHLQRMTDDVGLFQHARFGLPDRHHGYCTDDNARALLVALVHRGAGGSSNPVAEPSADALIDRYLAFLAHAQNPGGRLRNFMGYDRRWLEPAGSEDSHGRALWALGHTVRDAPHDAQRQLARQMFNAALPALADLNSPRTWAFATLGLVAAHTGQPLEHAWRRTLAATAGKLFDWSGRPAGDDLTAADPAWPWPEPRVTYDNCRIPQALILAGEYLEQPALTARGGDLLSWLLTRRTGPDGVVHPVGNAGWLGQHGHHAVFDQQPVEAAATVEACCAADRARLPGHDWNAAARAAFAWFYGHNALGLTLVDRETGGAFDGLHRGGVNQNQGAESVLALLAAAQALDAHHA